MTLDKNILFNLVLATLIFTTVPALAALKESRLEVYISMYTLEYFVCLALFRPRRKTLDFIAIALFIIFAYIVALKILEILIK